MTHRLHNRKRRALSDLLAAIILIALTIIASAYVYNLFTRSAGIYSNLGSLQIQGATISGNNIVLEVANTGSTYFTSLKVVVAGVNVTGTFTPPALGSGKTSVFVGTGNFVQGQSYLLVVIGTTSSNSTVEASATVTAQ